MTYNKIHVSFGALRKITGPTISYQYDVQQILVINGLNLPEYYEVDFCNEGDTYTETIVGTVDGGVAIPNKFLRTGKKVKAYLVLVGDGDVQTRYEITLPVNVRPQRQDIDPTDDQQLQIDSLVAALNSGVASAEAAAKRAEDASTHTPQIVGGYWYLWDSDTEQYVTSGVKAEGIDGTDGVGISSVRLNADYTLTLVFTDESEYTTPISIRGPKGDPFRYEDFTEEQKAELVQGPIKDAQTAAVEAVNAAGTTQTGNVNQAGTSKVTEINQAGTSAVNAVNQAGETQVNAVNRAGTTQVGNVQTEGRTQVQAVEDKGAEVLDSIPQDYSDLVDDVADLSRQLNDLEDDVTDTQGMLATVETTTTASKNYAVGDLLVYDGKLYEVTSAIATGATITVGTNVTQTTVESQIASGGGEDNWCVIANMELTEAIGSSSANQVFLDLTTDIDGNLLSDKKIRHLAISVYYANSDDGLPNAPTIQLNGSNSTSGGFPIGKNLYTTAKIDVLNSTHVLFWRTGTAQSFNDSTVLMPGAFAIGGNILNYKDTIDRVRLRTNYPNATIFPAGSRIMITGW